MTKHIFLYLANGFLFLSTQGCSQPIPAISGQITVAAGWKPVVYAIRPGNFKDIAANYSGQQLDSAVISADGHFEFKDASRIPDNSLIQLCVQKLDSKYPNKLLNEDPALSNYMPLVYHQEDPIVVTSSTEHFQAEFDIKNASPENQALLQLRDIRQLAFAKLASFQSQDEAHDPDFLLEAEAALLQFQEALIAFADNSSHLMPVLVAARWVSPVGDYERIPEFIVGLCEKWSKSNAGETWVTQLCQLADRSKFPVLVGDTLPNFDLPMLDGDTVPLQKLYGERLTILDIWASWCAPCRRENRAFLLPLWTAHKSEGLQIIGYSIDSSPKAWQAAIQKDAANWPQASHLTGDATPFMDFLRIRTIPANFILDAQGKVLAKNLYGQALNDFVQQYLKE